MKPPLLESEIDELVRETSEVFVSWIRALTGDGNYDSPNAAESAWRAAVEHIVNRITEDGTDREGELLDQIARLRKLMRWYEQHLCAIRLHWKKGVSEDTIKDPSRPWYGRMDELLGGTVED